MRLLQQFNQKMPPQEAEKRAHALYKYSKGVRKKFLIPSDDDDDDDEGMIQLRWDEGT